MDLMSIWISFFSWVMIWLVFVTIIWKNNVWLKKETNEVFWRKLLLFLCFTLTINYKGNGYGRPGRNGLDWFERWKGLKDLCKLGPICLEAIKCDEWTDTSNHYAGKMVMHVSEDDEAGAYQGVGKKQHRAYLAAHFEHERKQCRSVQVISVWILHSGPFSYVYACLIQAGTMPLFKRS